VGTDLSAIALSADPTSQSRNLDKVVSGTICIEQENLVRPLPNVTNCNS